MSVAACVGQTLVATPGTWLGTPTSYGYQWWRCDSTGANCSLIPGATSSSYLVLSADIGNTLRAQVIAYNKQGSASQMGDHTGIVTTVGSTAATYPSVLSAWGQNIVDENGYVMPFLKGFNIQSLQVTPWSAQTFLDIYSLGGRVLRTLVFWDLIEPTQGNISSTYIANLDTHIQRLQAAGLYTWLCLYYGPNGTHSPAWAGGTSTMSTFTTNGQNVTQYLAKRYGDVADPLGGGQYTKAVIGFGINEPTPDSQVSSKISTLESEQSTVIGWFRTYASDWIGVVCVSFACATLQYNLVCAGQSTQNNWTNSSSTAYDAVGGNVIYDLHCYFMGTTSASDPWDGRQANGEDFKVNQGGTQIKTSNAADGVSPSDYHAYPPTISGTVASRSLMQDQQRSYVCPYKTFCATANIPLIIGEFGWQGAINTTGGTNWITDLLAVWRNAGAVGALQWDYNTNQASDSWAARPGAAAGGADANGWQTVTNSFMSG